MCLHNVIVAMHVLGHRNAWDIDEKGMILNVVYIHVTLRTAVIILNYGQV